MQSTMTLAFMRVMAFAGISALAGTPLQAREGQFHPASEFGHVRVKAAALPDFGSTPRIAAAVPNAFGTAPVVRALYRTRSGFQIYRCTHDASGQPVWQLRTPLTELEPKALTALLVGRGSNRYHMLSQFGELVNDAELAAMGLLGGDGVRSTAPVWQFTFTGSHESELNRRETVAGRVIAQDSVSTADIPWLLIQVRGRAVSTITDGVMIETGNIADPRRHPIAASEYLLRFNTRGGVAPAAATCDESAIGSESQQPYAADYYFIDIDAPA